MKVGVLGHDRESVGPSVGPHGGVIGSGKADVAHMKRLRVQIGESLGEFSGVILCGPESSKRSAAGDAGISVDVWIDDAPATVDTLPAVRGVSLSVARASAAVTVARIAANVRAQ